MISCLNYDCNLDYYVAAGEMLSPGGEIECKKFSLRSESWCVRQLKTSLVRRWDGKWFSCSFQPDVGLGHRNSVNTHPHSSIVPSLYPFHLHSVVKSSSCCLPILLLAVPLYCNLSVSPSSLSLRLWFFWTLYGLYVCGFCSVVSVSQGDVSLSTM